MEDRRRVSEVVKHWAEGADEPHSLVGLVLPDDPSLIQGSGTLLRIAGDPFLVTASHVLKSLIDGKGRAAKVAVFLNDRTLSLRGDAVMGTDENKHDVGIVRLADETADQIVAGGGYFLSTWHIEIVPPPELSTGFCLVFGFPTERSVRLGNHIEHGPQGLICEIVSPTAHDDLPSTYDPRQHVLLKRRPVMTDVYNGKDEAAVNPKGMSGGSVWWLGTENDPGTPEDRTGNTRWIGIQSSWLRPDGPLKVASLGAIATLLREHFPYLRDALDLHRFSAVHRKPWSSGGESGSG